MALLLDEVPIVNNVILYDTNFAALGHKNISNDSYLEVRDNSGQIFSEGVDYVINYNNGSIRRTGNSIMTANKEYQVTYRYHPFTESTYLSGEDGNLAFDGIKLKVYNDDRVEFDSEISGWVEGNTNLGYSVARSPLNLVERQPGDFEIIFSEQLIDSALAVTNGIEIIDVKYSVRDITRGVPIRVPTFLSENFETKNQAWDSGEDIVFFKTGSEGGITDTTTWTVKISNPADAPGIGEKLLKFALIK